MILKTKTLALYFFGLGVTVLFTSATEGNTWEAVSHSLSSVIIFCIAFYLYFAENKFVLTYNDEGKK
ncbi:MAG: hypothetical protein Q8M92_03845 [Candidatus Subteraquimicrobiales bacterium]|nr:hypothetical protein [Candidatus Subteraquimicrobiales bacterium]